MHIVNDLKTNLLLDLNILELQKVHLNYEYERLVIDNCKDMTMLMKIAFIKNKMKKIMRTFIATIILAYNIIIILIRLCENTSLFNDRNLMFIFY